MKKKKKAENKSPLIDPSKIDEIVPYTDELDYIKDYDGNYGLDDVRFRFEFEMSPDGVHIVRPVSEIHPDGLNATHELIIREARLLAKKFGFTEEQLKIPSIFKEFVRITTLWYIVTKYPLAHLRKLVQDGYFKHPEEVVDFIITIDDFADAEEVVSQLYVPYQENGYLITPGKNAEDVSYEDEEDEEQMYSIESPDELELVAVEYDRSREYEIFERISEINRILKETLDSEKREELLEEKRALTAKIRRMREEFLSEHNLTYEEFVMLRREKQITGNWGWVKYPMYGEDEEYDKWKMIEDNLLEKLEELNLLINTLKTEKEGLEDDKEEEDHEKYNLSELIEKRRKLLSSIKRIRNRRMSPEEKKVCEIYRLIDRIYRLGKDKNRLAYKLSNDVKARIKKIKSYAKRKALYSFLNETWKKRSERFEKLFGRKTNFANHQLSFFELKK